MNYKKVIEEQIERLSKITTPNIEETSRLASTIAELASTAATLPKQIEITSFNHWTNIENFAKELEFYQKSKILNKTAPEVPAQRQSIEELVAELNFYRSRTSHKTE